MKKIQFFLFLMASVILTSCGEDDNVKKNDDSIFSAEYTPLKNLSDVTSKNWFYEGIKVGDRKFGKISPKNCLASNFLFLLNDKLAYKSNTISKKESGCEEDYIRVFESSELVSDGVLAVKIIGQKLGEVLDPDTKEKKIDYVTDRSYTTYEGNIEIGFQSGMLRIEDRFSGANGKEKIYLYFKQK